MSDDGDDYVRITATVEALTPMAVKLATDEISSWVPRSCLAAADDIALREIPIDGEREFKVRRWIAQSKGFI